MGPVLAEVHVTVSATSVSQYDILPDYIYNLIIIDYIIHEGKSDPSVTLIATKIRRLGNGLVIVILVSKWCVKVKF